jgi:hypothetical protein
MGYSYRPSPDRWILIKLVGHEAGCFEAPTPAGGATAGEAVPTAKQAARAVLNSPLADLYVYLATARSASSSCFLRTSSTR